MFYWLFLFSLTILIAASPFAAALTMAFLTLAMLTALAIMGAGMSVVVAALEIRCMLRFPAFFDAVVDLGHGHVPAFLRRDIGIIS